MMWMESMPNLLKCQPHRVERLCDGLGIGGRVVAHAPSDGGLTIALPSSDSHTYQNLQVSDRPRMSMQVDRECARRGTAGALEQRLRSSESNVAAAHLTSSPSGRSPSGPFSNPSGGIQ